VSAKIAVPGQAREECVAERPAVIKLEGIRPVVKSRSISSKFSTFTLLLLGWVVLMVIMWDLRTHTFDLTKGFILCVVALLVAGAISRFTIRVLARPLALLQRGITSVRQGKFEPVQVSATGDEIEDLGQSFNRMIEELFASQREIQQHRELLEERIRQRTEELENAMKTALAASHAKSEFLANMSHELRTPMNGLLGMLDVVLDSKLSSEQRDHLQTAQRSAYSLLALLNDILDLSKIEAGKMVLEKIPFNIRTVLDDCLKAFQARASQKKITLHLEMDASAPGDVMGDPLRVRQIVTNLLSNAIKFTDQGWVCLRLSAARSGSDQNELRNIHIEVSDTGTGIEADKLQAIFDKFTQADGSITRKYGGTGLGLAITKRLAELHGGHVRVDSQVGKGSTFTVAFPWEVVESSVKQPLTPAFDAIGTAATNGLKPTSRILLVEDNLINQKVVIAILKKKGYSIDVANDGREALSSLDANPRAFDLVLMDIQMPVLDGLETTRLIRRDPRWDSLPIVAMTAHAMNGDKERCLQAGMNGYISKPVQSAHLLTTISHFLNRNTVETSRKPANPIERALTDRLMREETAMVNDLLHVFLQLAPERMDRIEVAASQSDRLTLGTEARKIAAAADQLASREVGDCAHRIEKAAERGDFEAAISDLAVLREEIRSLEALAH
jgi:signal transduction histidine kinase/DNA-binding response OmpR family regulator